MCIIKVKGVSQKGKNRIKEFGEEWKIKREDVYNGEKAYLLESLIGDYIRWMQIRNDKDFVEVP